MHLPEFAGLGQRICLVDQKNNAGIVFAAASGGSLRCLLHL
jgi:hypothetical protein